MKLLDEADLEADDVARELAGALVCPVVTAHPTEVRRRTISQVQRHVTDLIRQRDRTASSELPPGLKKLSSRPMVATGSTSAHASATAL